MFYWAMKTTTGFSGVAPKRKIFRWDRRSTKDAQHLYKLFNDAAKEMKAISQSHLVAICNGDLLFLDIIVRECK